MDPVARTPEDAIREALHGMGGHSHWREGGAGGSCWACERNAELRLSGRNALVALVAENAAWMTPFDGSGVGWHESLPSPYTYKASDFNALVAAVHEYEARLLSAQRFGAEEQRKFQAETLLSNRLAAELADMTDFRDHHEEMKFHALGERDAALRDAQQLRDALATVRAKNQRAIDGGQNSDASVFMGAVQACDEVAALSSEGQPRSEWPPRDPHGMCAECQNDNAPSHWHARLCPRYVKSWAGQPRETQQGADE